MREWLHAAADSLFVVGFCVIGFLKFTFLGLLRFEIKEMIQKIRVLKNENQVRDRGRPGISTNSTVTCITENSEKTGDRLKPVHQVA